MTKDEIDTFFIKNESEILKFSETIYYNLLREFTNIIEPDEFMNEFYLYCVEHRYKYKELHTWDIINPLFIQTLRYKYRIEIECNDIFDKIINNLNKVCKNKEFTTNLLNPALYILKTNKYSKQTKTYRKAKKIIDKELENEIM